MPRSYCDNCGSPVYRLGCVNCDEENYIAQQRYENDIEERRAELERLEAERRAEEAQEAKR